MRLKRKEKRIKSKEFKQNSKLGKNLKIKFKIINNNRPKLYIDYNNYKIIDYIIENQNLILFKAQ